MELTERAQELLEQLWVVTEEKDQPSLELGEEDTVEAAVSELIEAGFVAPIDGHLALTPAGRPEAEGAIRRHRLAERLLVDLLATEDPWIEERACRFEHALFDGVDDAVCTLLGHPRYCPHGRSIPAGPCCREHRDTVHKLVAPLVELQAGQAGHIAYLQTRDSQRLQKLIAMGVLPGAPIQLLHRSPTFVFQAGYSQFAVDADIAADIYVRLTE